MTEPDNFVELESARRLLAGVVRSGSTALLHTLSQHPALTVQSGQVREQVRRGEVPDFSVYGSDSAIETTAVYRALLGPRDDDSAYALFPEDRDTIELLRPIFLFRHPESCWASWRAAGYDSESNFATAYRSLVKQFRSARELVGPSALAVFYEELAESPVKGLQAILDHWRIQAPASDGLLPWRRGLSAASTSSNPGRKSAEKFSRHMRAGLHQTLADGDQTFRFVRPRGVDPRRPVPLDVIRLYDGLR